MGERKGKAKGRVDMKKFDLQATLVGILIFILGIVVGLIIVREALIMEGNDFSELLLEYAKCVGK